MNNPIPFIFLPHLFFFVFPLLHDIVGIDRFHQLLANTSFAAITNHSSSTAIRISLRNGFRPLPSDHLLPPHRLRPPDPPHYAVGICALAGPLWQLRNEELLWSAYGPFVILCVVISWRIVRSYQAKFRCIIEAERRELEIAARNSHDRLERKLRDEFQVSQIERLVSGDLYSLDYKVRERSPYGGTYGHD